jgi:hypothetical protein
LDIAGKIVVASVLSFIVALALALIPSTNHSIITTFNGTLNSTQINDLFKVVGLNSHSRIDILSKIIPLLIAAIPPIGVAISWKRTRTSTFEHAEEDKASIYYRYDYNTSTLQSELENTLHKLSHNNYQQYKVIFIIDEIDKLPESSVISVIKSLKMLFNQSSNSQDAIVGRWIGMKMICYNMKQNLDQNAARIEL